MLSLEQESREQLQNSLDSTSLKKELGVIIILILKIGSENERKIKPYLIVGQKKS